VTCNIVWRRVDWDRKEQAMSIRMLLSYVLGIVLFPVIAVIFLVGEWDARKNYDTFDEW
jgi:hypothetical protein